MGPRRVGEEDSLPRGARLFRRERFNGASPGRRGRRHPTAGCAHHGQSLQWASPGRRGRPRVQAEALARIAASMGPRRVGEEDAPGCHQSPAGGWASMGPRRVGEEDRSDLHGHAVHILASMGPRRVGEEDRSGPTAMPSLRGSFNGASPGRRGRPRATHPSRGRAPSFNGASPGRRGRRDARQPGPRHGGCASMGPRRVGEEDPSMSTSRPRWPSRFNGASPGRRGRPRRMLVNKLARIMLQWGLAG